MIQTLKTTQMNKTNDQKKNVMSNNGDLSKTNFYKNQIAFDMFEMFDK